MFSIPSFPATLSLLKYLPRVITDYDQDMVLEEDTSSRRGSKIRSIFIWHTLCYTEHCIRHFDEETLQSVIIKVFACCKAFQKKKAWLPLTQPKIIMSRINISMTEPALLRNLFKCNFYNKGNLKGGFKPLTALSNYTFETNCSQCQCIQAFISGWQLVKERKGQYSS